MKRIQAETLTYLHHNSHDEGEMDLVIGVVFEEETARAIGIPEEANNQGCIFATIQDGIMKDMFVNDGGGELAPFVLEGKDREDVLKYLEDAGIWGNYTFSVENERNFLDHFGALRGK